MSSHLITSLKVRCRTVWTRKRSSECSTSNRVCRTPPPPPITIRPSHGGYLATIHSAHPVHFKLRSKATSELRLSRRKIGLIFPGDQLLVIDTYGPSETKLFNLNVNGYRLRAKIGSRQLFTLEKHTFVVDSTKDEKASLKGRRATVADAKDPWPERCVQRTKLYDDVVAAARLAQRKAKPRFGLAYLCEDGSRLPTVADQQYASFINELCGFIYIVH